MCVLLFSFGFVFRCTNADDAKLLRVRCSLIFSSSMHTLHVTVHVDVYVLYRRGVVF